MCACFQDLLRYKDIRGQFPAGLGLLLVNLSLSELLYSSSPAA